MQLINPSTSSNELNTTLTPHSITHGDACFAYFNKIWGIPFGGGNAFSEKIFGWLTISLLEYEGAVRRAAHRQTGPRRKASMKRRAWCSQQSAAACMAAYARLRCRTSSDVGRARAREGWQGETPAGPTMSR